MHPDRDVDPPPGGGSKTFLIILALAAAIVAVIYVARSPGRSPVGISHHGVGNPLSKLDVEPLLNTDRRVTLADVRGQVTLVNFWGPWCPPCLMELPELLQLEKKYRGRDDVRVLLVSSSGGSGQTLEELHADTESVLLRERGDSPIYHDEDNNTIEALIDSAQLQGFAFPTTILLDGTGTIRAVWSGYHRRFVEEMGQAIEQTLAKKG